jgi:hypothetical protein
VETEKMNKTDKLLRSAIYYLYAEKRRDSTSGMVIALPRIKKAFILSLYAEALTDVVQNVKR